MPLVKLRKEDLKVITREEQQENFLKENMWFSFYRPPFYVPTYCDFSDETIKEMKEEYDKGSILTINPLSAEDLFNHKKLTDILSDLSFPFIRFYTKENELLYSFYHDQHMNKVCSMVVGNTSDHMIYLINFHIDKITYEVKYGREMDTEIY